MFTAEVGTRFYLKLNLSANPWPTTSNLYKNGVAMQSVPWGTTTLNVDSVNIPNVQSTDTAYYKITCSNLFGEGQFYFQLNAVGKGVIMYFVSANNLQILAFFYATVTNAYKQLTTFDLRDQAHP